MAAGQACLDREKKRNRYGGRGLVCVPTAGLASVDPSDESEHAQSQCVSMWCGSVFFCAGVPARMVRSAPIYEGRGKIVTLLSSRRMGGSEYCGACSKFGSGGSSRADSTLEQQMMEPIYL